jgi:RimJ/RimL family protein N-acetyltransferase
VPFDETYRDCSFDWLSDPFIAQQTQTGSFTREQQRAWFKTLPTRTDYAVWGIECDGEPAGGVGLRYIGLFGGAEAFLYIGEARFQERGIARWALEELDIEARARGLGFLLARMGHDNPRSLAVSLRHGFVNVREDPEGYFLVKPL